MHSKGLAGYVEGGDTASVEFTPAVPFAAAQARATID